MALVPLVLAALLLSVIVPAVETQRVLRLLNEINGILGPSRDVTDRLHQVAEHERQSLFFNAALVIVALAAIGAVVAASIRERRLAAILRRRVDEEKALGQMARALGEAVTIEEAIERILEGTTRTIRGVGAYLEIMGGALYRSAALIDAGPVTHFGVHERLPIPLANELTAQNKSGLPYELDGMDWRLPPDLILDCFHCRGLVVPLLLAGESPGILVVLRDARSGAFAENERCQMRLIGDLASSVIRRIDVERNALEEVENVMKSRERLMRGFSHDVKNPLGAADGYADLLSAGIYGEISPEQTEAVQRIRRSIRRALGLIDDLHELARVEAGSIALRNELVDVADLVKTSAEDYRAAAHAAGLPLTVDVSDDLPPVGTDSVRVRQVIGNLISNAIKYTKTGAVTLRVRKHSALPIRKTGSWIDIEVIDTGVGIPADKYDKIFEEFSRLDTSDRPGAGLGLAISKRLAEALGGQIKVSSEVGCGSTFTFRIPVTVPATSSSSGTTVVRESTNASLYESRV